MKYIKIVTNNPPQKVNQASANSGVPFLSHLSQISSFAAPAKSATTAPKIIKSFIQKRRMSKAVISPIITPAIICFTLSFIFVSLIPNYTIVPLTSDCEKVT